MKKTSSFSSNVQLSVNLSTMPNFVMDNNERVLAHCPNEMAIGDCLFVNDLHFAPEGFAMATLFGDDYEGRPKVLEVAVKDLQQALGNYSKEVFNLMNKPLHTAFTVKAICERKIVINDKEYVSKQYVLNIL